jgi:hypothetical protein
LTALGNSDQHAVAGDFKDAALILCHQRLQHLLAPSFEGGQRAGFVGLHQPAVADYVGGKDCDKAAAFHAECLWTDKS